MKKYLIYILCLGVISNSCAKFLERPPLDTVEFNPELWNTESNVRNQVIGLYKIYFEGYKEGWERSDYFDGNHVSEWTDDLAQQSATFFTLNIPPNEAAVNPYNEGKWNFDNVRRINIIIENLANSKLDPEVKNHWLGVSRFFRALEYSSLVRKFGDVPWFDQSISNLDLTTLYKPRTPRKEVMDHVMADLEFAIQNVRLSDGPKGLSVNKDVVLAYASRLFLFEGTWQKYRANNNQAAQKYLKFTKQCADQVITSGRYQLADDYNSLTKSLDLAGNPEMILYRSYVLGLVTHAEMSWQNELPEKNSPSKDVIETFLTSSGLPIHQAGSNYVNDLTLSNELKNRDPRLLNHIDTIVRLDGVEKIYAVSGYFSVRFVNPSLKGRPEGSSVTNATDAPIIRYAEILLNYIESAAELNDLNVYTLTQADFDKSFNQLRTRKSVNMPEVTLQAAKLYVNNQEINDPKKDPTVTPILWEIRRERRVELLYEGQRFNDLRRWSKLGYADMKKNPLLNLGAWLDKDLFPSQYNALTGIVLTADQLKNIDAISLDRSGRSGYILPISDPNKLRVQNEKDYLYPIPLDQIKLYKDQGFELINNPYW